ncbi:hypothetical protein C8Q76DRAFT_798368 [Earliella scabrosa]|nr:hypothetical protein C8Q76DRAFT_798368 [Earliella scabrosa]
MADVESFTLVCKGMGTSRFLEDSRLLFASLGNSLTTLHVVSPKWYDSVYPNVTMNAVLSPIYECSLLHDLEISLPTTYFTFRLADLQELFSRCFELRSLSLSFPIRDGSSIPEIQDIFLIIPTHLVSLHLPALKTTMSGQQYELTPRPLFTALSSDRLTLGHHILDIASALSTTSLCKPTSVDIASSSWINIYLLIGMLKNKDMEALTNFLVSEWSRPGCTSFPSLLLLDGLRLAHCSSATSCHLLCE